MAMKETSTEREVEPRRLLWEGLGVAVLLGFYAGLALSAVVRKSVTFDEISHVATGYCHFKTRDYYLHPENGLPQEWAALALLRGSWSFPSVDQPLVPLGEPHWYWYRHQSFRLGEQFFYQSGNNADALLLRARTMASVL